MRSANFVVTVFTVLVLNGNTASALPLPARAQEGIDGSKNVAWQTSERSANIAEIIQIVARHRIENTVDAAKAPAIQARGLPSHIDPKTLTGNLTAEDLYEIYKAAYADGAAMAAKAPEAKFMAVMGSIVYSSAIVGGVTLASLGAFTLLSAEKQHAFLTPIQKAVNKVFGKNYSIEQIAKGMKLALKTLASGAPITAPDPHSKRDADANGLPQYYDDAKLMLERENEVDPSM